MTLRYTPSDCFDTFPFPEGWETDSSLEAAGRSYYEYRAALMVEHDKGMTRTYNRFHDIYETNPRIVELRELHAAMDRAVLDAYGWTDIPTDCEFLLEYEIRRGNQGPKEEALPLPLAGHRPRRSSLTPPCPQCRTRGCRGPFRCPRRDACTPSAMAQSDRFVRLG